MIYGRYGMAFYLAEQELEHWRREALGSRPGVIESVEVSLAPSAAGDLEYMIWGRG
jgi:hypothetical protein